MTEWDALADWLEEQGQVEWSTMVRREHGAIPRIEPGESITAATINRPVAAFGRMADAGPEAGRAWVERTIAASSYPAPDDISGEIEA